MEDYLAARKVCPTGCGRAAVPISRYRQVPKRFPRKKADADLKVHPAAHLMVIVHMQKES